MSTATRVRKDLEAWKNETAGTVVVKKLDHRGELNKTELVRGGGVVHLSTEERRMNQEMAANQRQDVFSTGVLTPVHLLDTAEDAKEIASNPNLLSEDDMRALVKGHPKTFEKRLSEIVNPTTLQRLMAIAKDEDASFKRVEAIKDRLRGVSPQVNEVSTAAPPPEETGRNKYGRPRGITPQ